MVKSENPSPYGSARLSRGPIAGSSYSQAPAQEHDTGPSQGYGNPQRSPQASIPGPNNEYDSIRSFSEQPSSSWREQFPPMQPPPLPSAKSRTTDYTNQHQTSAALPERPKPPIPKRKPDSLHQRKVSQATQIQDNVEDVSFTKDDVIIAVMGVTGAGKSTFISLLSEESIEIGHGLQSCTTKVGVYYFNYQGLRIFLVDTPGFDDTNRSDSEVLKDVAFWLAAAYSKQTRLAGIIYLHRISDDRMPGSALRNLRMFNKLCGENNLGSVVLATTHWTNLKTGISIDEETGEARTKELIGTKSFWGGMVDNGSQVVKHDGTRQSAIEIVLNIVGRENRVVLDIQRQLVDQKLDLNETDAAQALQSELLAERKRFEKQLSNLKEEMKDAIRENDLKAQREIKEEQAKAEAEIRKTRDETAALRTTLEQIAKEKDEQYRQLQEEMAKQRQEYQDQIKRTTSALEAEKEKQRRRAEQYQKERREDEARRASEAAEHQRKMMDMQERMRNEHNQVILAQLEGQRQDQERWHTTRREEADAAAREEQARWERQSQLYNEKQEELARSRDEADKKIRELDLQQRKSKGFFLGALKGLCNVASLGFFLTGRAPWVGFWT